MNLHLTKHITGKIAALTLLMVVSSIGFLQAQCETGLVVTPASITICPNETVAITIENAEAGLTYSLYEGGSPTGSDAVGSGSNLTLTSDLITSSTTISVRATDFGACDIILDNTVDVTVAVPSPPTAADPTPICEGEPIPVLTASGSGTIRWYSDAGLSDQIGAGASFTPSPPVVDNSTAGTYSVYVTQQPGGCESTAEQVDIVVNTMLVADAGGDDEVCQGSSTVIGGSPAASGGDNSFTYAWSPAGSLDDASLANPTATPGTTTLYTLTVTDGNGCSETDEVLITVNSLPVAFAGSDVAICAGESATLNGMGFGGSGAYTYAWTPTAGLDDPAISNPVASPGVTTVYTLTVTDAKGCISTGDNVTVTVNNIPAAPSASDPAPICEGAAMPTLTATGSGTLTWYSDAALTNQIGTGGSFTPAPPAVDNTSAGSYVVYVTDNVSGCESAATPVTVVVDQQPSADAGAGGDACALSFPASANPSIGTGSWSKVSGPGSVSFIPGSATSNITVDTYGTYVFRWTEDNNGCISTDDITVTYYQDPTANAGTGGDACGFDFLLGATPSVTGSTGAWTYSGPGTATFNNATSPNATATVSTYGTYTFTWTETNGVCSDDASVVVNYYEPPVADAGPDDAICGLDYTLAASLSTGTGSWSLISGPGTAGFDDASSETATATVTTYGTYVFRWTEDNNGCISTDDITVTYYESPVANAGTGGDACGLDFLLSATPSVTGSTGAWTYSGPGTATFNNATSPNATATVDTYGTYTFTWTETNGVCSDAASVVVNYYEPPVADAGSGGQVCGFTFAVAANPSVGSGSWSQVSGPGSVSFVPGGASTDITVDAYGTYVFRWTEDNNGCISTDDITVTYYESPVANAGTGGDACGLDFLLGATPSVTGSTGAWTYSGPGTASFNNPTSPNATATVDTYGTYTFTWTETNGVCSDAASVVVNYYEPPVADAGSGGQVCGFTFAVAANPSVGSGSWSQVSGPGSVSFVPGGASTDITVDAYGTYVFRWTEDNNGCISTDDITVTYYESPVANAGTGGDACGLDFLLGATPSVTGSTGAWTYSGPGTATFNNATSPNATATVSTYGTYTFTWTETNGVCSDAASVVVNYYEPPVADAGSGGQVCGFTFAAAANPSVGSGSWSQVSGPGSVSFVPGGASTDITVDAYGTYVFRWAEDNNGCISTDDITVTYYQDPTANAGTGGDACGLDFLLSATPSVTGSTGAWTYSGPGTASFNNPASPNATATVSTYGTYTFTWTETNGVCSDAASVVVNYYEPPVADAGSGGQVCGFTFAVAANPSVGSGSWSQVSGPGSVSFVPGGASTDITVDAYGTYVFRWTEDNNGCISTDDITVTYYESPVANAGTGGDACGLDFLLGATPSVTGSTGAWTYSGPGTASFNNPASPNATATVDTYGTYTFTWTETNGVCSDAASVVVNYYEPPVADAGSGGQVCGFTFAAAANPSVGSGSWSQVSGPGSVSFVPGGASTDITVDAYGTYVFRWTEDNNGCSSTDDITVTYYESPVANAGTGGDACGLDFLLGATPSVTGSTGAWTYSGPGTASFNNPASPNATATVDTYGTYTFTWTETNGVCSDAASVVVNYYEPPVADAGSGGQVCGFTFAVAANPSVGSGSWSQVSGPGSVSFVPGGASTDITVDAYGTYVFRWTEDNNGCISTDDITVTYYESPVANAGTGGDACGLDFLLSATPSVTGSTGAWTYSGPGTATFNNATSPNATATVDTYGTYTFTWTETNGVCSDAASVVVNYYEPPVADAGSGGQVCGFTFAAAANPSVGSGSWSQVSGPGSVSFVPGGASTDISVDAYGTYVFRWTEDNNGCISTDDITVTYFESPVANAGTGGDACGLDFLLSATPSVTGSTGAWTYSGPGTATFNNATSPNATATVSTYGTYTFTWTETNGVCSDAASVVVNYYEPPVADAGSGGQVCGFTFAAAANPSVGSGSWSQVSGPGSVSFVPGGASTDITVDAYGTYVFRWTEDNNGCISTDDITVTYYESPVAIAGTGGDACGLDFLLSATPSVTGSTGAWTYSGPGTATFNNATSPNATATVDTYGTYTFTWTETNGVCSDAASVVVNYYEPPVADAGSGGQVCGFTFAAAANPSVGSGSWSQVSGPGSVSFVPGGASTDITVDAYGTYVFRWTEDNNGCISTDDITVTYYESPVANAGTGGDACGLDFLLSATPSVTGSTGAWTYSGPGTATFNNATSPNATATVSTYGTYTFTWTETNGVCSDAASVVVNYYEPPVADAGPDDAICGLDYTLAASLSTGTGSWSLISGPGTAGFDDASSETATATVSTYGTYVFRWTEDNNGCVSADDVTINYNQAPEVVGVNNNGAVYCEPASVTISGTIGGSASLGVWSLVSGGTGTLSSSSISGSLISAEYFPGAGEFGPLVFELTTNDPDGAGPCIADTQQLTIIINEAPQVSAGADFMVCEDAGFAQLSGVTGGSSSSAVWSGGAGTFADINDPATQYTFDPSEIGTSVVLTLTVLDPDGSGPCTQVMDQVVLTVNPLPEVNFFNLPAVTDEGADPVELVGNSQGGTFTISPGGGIGPTYVEDGLDKVQFTPSTASIGMVNTVTYTFTNSNGCTNSISKNVVVNAVTSNNFSIETATTTNNPDELLVCEDLGQLRLIGAPDPSTGTAGTEFTSPTVGLVQQLPSGQWVFNSDITDPGVYEVTYTYVNSEGAPSTTIKDIIVQGTPEADFTIPASTCDSQSIQFMDISTMGGVAIPADAESNGWTWLWQFGDGDTTSVRNPEHTYDVAKTYFVALTVTSNTGCSNTIVKELSIGSVPEPDFTWISACEGQATPFQNATLSDSTAVVDEYTWDFGDGYVISMPSGSTIPAGTHGGRTSGPIENPEHMFDSYGDQTVTLSVRTTAGCENSIEKLIDVRPYFTINVVDGYNENFSGGDDKSWSVDIRNSTANYSWEYGNPADFGGSEMWYTGDSGVAGYNNNEISQLNGPCFNIDALNKPMIAFDLYYQTEPGTFDGAVFQYSVDGETWSNLGRTPVQNQSSGINWFNTNGIISRPGDGNSQGFNNGQQGWSSSADELTESRAYYNLNQIPDDAKSRVRFRLAFASDKDSTNLGFGIDNIFIGEKSRTVVVEQFADAGIQESMDEAQKLADLQRAQIETNDYSDFIILSYPMNTSGSDPFYDFSKDDSNLRSLYYGIAEAPAYVVNGSYNQNFQSIDAIDTMIVDAAALRDPKFAIDIDTLASSDDRIAFEVHVRALADMADAPLSLQIAIAEDYDDGTMNMNHVNRKMVFVSNGGVIEGTWATDEIRSYTGEWVLDDAMDINRSALDIVAFVQNNITREIYQSAVVEAPVKNSSEIVTGLEDEFNRGELKIYPNPASNYVKIRMPVDAIGKYHYQLIDLRGIAIRSGEITRVFNDFVIDTSQITDGVYHIRVIKDGVPVTIQKLLILK